MDIQKIGDMQGGWFVGNFQPHMLFTEDFEVAIKRYKAGDKEAAHVHRVAIELTVCVSGEFQMTQVINGQAQIPITARADDVVILDPGDAVAFEALTDCVCCVVKTPSVKGDKYPV